ncbi:MAG TPA: metallophosphoesterase family protein [Gemmatimonadaceae bacterium]
MRYALISDIHANLPALEAVLEDIGRRDDADATFHLGDLVGYAPWPNEVVECVQRAGIPGVAGNYDSTIAADYKHCGCRAEDPRQEELSHLSYAWTREHVSAPAKAVLAALPFQLELRPLGGHVSGPRVVLVHAHPTNNLVYVDVSRSDAFLEKMAVAASLSEGDVLCFGHTHVPWHRTVDGVHFVNTGSVGRPKDGDWRAGYVLLDVGTRAVEVDVIRVEYDVERSMQGIRESALPDEFAEFLRVGGRSAR